MAIGSHSWGFLSASTTGLPGLELSRARVIGGCSSHNGCAAVWGHRRDYDDWAASGNEGWDAESLLPVFRLASDQFQVWTPELVQITPWHRACMEAAPKAGFPNLPTLNDIDAQLGIGIISINVVEGVRQNAAFAYLDPVRDQSNLSILGSTLVDSVVIDRDRCVGVDIASEGKRSHISADRVVLAGGAYGSPLILLRSGIGPAEELEAAGIVARHDLPGVGRNLQDHPIAELAFSGTDRLVETMNEFVASGGDPREEGTTVLAKSSQCRRAFDLHLYPLGTRAPQGWNFSIVAALLTPLSTGTIRIAGPDPESAPRIDHGYFTDEEGRDLSALTEGLELAREMARQSPLAGLAGAETKPCQYGPALPAHIKVTAQNAHHQAGSCKMGPASDSSAVVDRAGKVHGIQGLYVGDAAIMPTVPRANTNLPTAVVGEKIAQMLLAG